MKYVFLFPGKTRESYIVAGIRDFTERLERFVQVEFVITREGSAGKLPPNVLKKKEALMLLDKCGDASFLVALDPGGREPDSEGLAHIQANWEERGLRTIHFIIGGHYGLHEEILHRADLVLSLSRMTFTHEMSRLVLLEQLYRGCMINGGRSYHY
ncbi:MAG: 23S rRNA (pseudouridine(1915)-N(3))-methyltransferase RlmH [Desulfobulbaceae bacterium]|nr:23S rRNA (pseudouridine(1915)-N(3))-methyltransferase RlmH [Desulfobulbaceae bacterium]